MAARPSQEVFILKGTVGGGFIVGGAVGLDMLSHKSSSKGIFLIGIIVYLPKLESEST